MRILFTVLFVLVMPVLLMAQDIVEQEPNTLEYVALAFNLGLVVALVQLTKYRALPWLKTNAPYLIPFISMAIAVLSTWVLTHTGIDLSPFGGVFEVGVASGGAASLSFVVGKELHNALTGKLAPRN